MQLVANFNNEPQGFTVADYAMSYGLLLGIGASASNLTARQLKLKKIGEVTYLFQRIGLIAFVGGFSTNFIKYLIDTRPFTS